MPVPFAPAGAASGMLCSALTPAAVTTMHELLELIPDQLRKRGGDICCGIKAHAHEQRPLHAAVIVVIFAGPTDSIV